MNIRNLLLCVALLSCSACASTSWNASADKPKPIDCAAEALDRCEAPEIERNDATLGESEEVDAVNRGRWERCIARHRAALACFAKLREVGVLRGD